MANALNKIYKDYIDFYFESSCSTTPQFASFARKIKNALKKDAEAVGLKLVEFSRGHFYISAFVLNPLTNQYAYISVSDVRWMLCGKRPLDDILYRTAKDEHDYHGGCNNFTDLPNLIERVSILTGRGV